MKLLPLVIFIFTGCLNVSAQSGKLFDIKQMAIFPHEGQLYHITTDYEKTYVSKIENRKFVNIDLVCDESIRTNDSEVIQTTNDHYVVFFRRDKGKGYLDVTSNKTSLMMCK